MNKKTGDLLASALGLFGLNSRKYSHALIGTLTFSLFLLTFLAEKVLPFSALIWRNAYLMLFLSFSVAVYIAAAHYIYKVNGNTTGPALDKVAGGLLAIYSTFNLYGLIWAFVGILIFWMLFYSKTNAFLRKILQFRKKLFEEITVSILIGAFANILLHILYSGLRIFPFAYQFIYGN